MNPRIGVAAIITKDGEVLLGKRLALFGKGDWCMPGGHLEFGESWEECARREVKEESGLDLGEVRFITATNDIFKSGKHYITLFMKAGYIGGEPEVLEPDKMTAWQWFSWDKLPAPLFLPIVNLLKGGFKLR